MGTLPAGVGTRQRLTVHRKTPYHAGLKAGTINSYFRKGMLLDNPDIMINALMRQLPLDTMTRKTTGTRETPYLGW